MKRTLFYFISALMLSACVQKAYRKTVVVKLSISGRHNIKTVGVRGNGNPLSWEQDYFLKPLIKDSVYTGIFTTVTGFKSTEIKFTVNGDFEMKNKPNRLVIFSDKSDTTYVNAVFNIPGN